MTQWNHQWKVKVAISKGHFENNNSYPCMTTSDGSNTKTAECTKNLKRKTKMMSIGWSDLLTNLDIEGSKK